MKFGILVQEGPYNHQASDSAYHFIQAALANGNEITGVFFYNDGVINSTKLIDVPADEQNLSKRWSELGAKGVQLIVCVAAAKRRGISQDILIENARIDGLGQLSELCIESDRMITFGD